VTLISCTAVTVTSTEDADEDVFLHMVDVVGPDFEEGRAIGFDVEQAPMPPARRPSSATEIAVIRRRSATD
jgi:cold shock CspA family protein